MNLKDLKAKTPGDLLSYAEELEIENARAALASRDSLKREGLLTGTSL